MSPLIQLEDKSWVILKCDRHIAPDPSKRFEDERLTLMEEIRNLKLAQRVNEIYPELRKRANPNPLLREVTRQDDTERAVGAEINGQTAPRITGPGRIGG